MHDFGRVRAAAAGPRRPRLHSHDRVAAMIFKDRIARMIAAGDVSHVFRRWGAIRTHPGSVIRSSAGRIEVTRIEQVTDHQITDEAARAAGEADAAAVIASLRGSADDPIFKVFVRYAGPDERIELRDTSALSRRDLDAISVALQRLDKASRHGPWTSSVLEAIAAHPGRRARELAELLDQDTDSLKLDVRKLKNLGLTCSLDTGYELSPRGKSFLAAAQ